MVGRKKKILISVLGLLLLVAAVPAGIFLVSQSQELRKSAAPATTLFFTPATLDKERGDEFTLSLEIDTGENAPSAADVTVVYDPEVLEFRTLTQGSFFSQSVSNLETIAPGSVRFVYYESETVGPEAEGILASLSFMVKAEAVLGSTEVVIDKAKSKVAASDPTFTEGTPGDVLVTVRSSVINVTSGGAVATATPTRTVTPTLPPGATTTPTPTKTPTPTVTPTLPPGVTTTPTPELVGCWQGCTTDADCEGDLVCESINGTYRCVNLDCETDSDCVCSVAATATPTATITPTPAVGATAAPTATVTPTVADGAASVSTTTPTPTVPVTGYGSPTTIIGVTAGLLILIGILALAI